jgi:hypothetical protein
MIEESVMHFLRYEEQRMEDGAINVCYTAVVKVYSAQKGKFSEFFNSNLKRQ